MVQTGPYWPKILGALCPRTITTIKMPIFGWLWVRSISHRIGVINPPIILLKPFPIISTTLLLVYTLLWMSKSLTLSFSYLIFLFLFLFNLLNIHYKSIDFHIPIQQGNLSLQNQIMRKPGANSLILDHMLDTNLKDLFCFIYETLRILLNLSNSESWRVQPHNLAYSSGLRRTHSNTSMNLLL